MHILGYGLVELVRAASLELGRYLTPYGPVLTNPYDMLASVSDGKSAPTAGSVETFLMLTIFECILAWRLISSTGLDLVLDSVDLRSQGWVFQHVVRPQRHGYTPLAYVLTSATHGEYGIGYEGTVADIRQGENGELKSIALAEPERFVYEIISRGDSDRRLPKLKTYAREWVGEMVSLDGATILNIVINNVSKDLIAELEGTSLDAEQSDEAQGASETTEREATDAP